MQVIPVVVSRSIRGDLKAKTTVPLNDTGRELQVATFKTSRGLVTMATVHQVSPEGFLTHVMGFGSCGDFTKRLADQPKARCTEKNIRAQHDVALSNFGDLIAEAQAWYEAGRDKR